MKSKPLGRLIALQIALLLSITAASQGFLRAQLLPRPPLLHVYTWWPEPATSRALSYIRLTQEDIRLRTDYTERDLCRLTFVDLSMTKPWQIGADLGMAATTMGWADSIPSDENSWKFQSRAAFGAAAHRAGQVGHEFVYMEVPIHGRPGWGDLLDAWPRDWQNFMIKVERALSEESWIDTILAKLNPDDKRLVLEQFPGIVLEDTADAAKSAEVLDSLQREEDQLAVRFVELTPRMRWARAREHWGRGLSELLESLPNLDSRRWPTVKRAVFDASFGQMIFGSFGDNHYTGNPAMIIDPGGDDTYELDSLPIGQNRLIIDLSGNDRYFAPNGHDLGAARFGWSLLIDVRGDDLYQGGNFSLGSGWFGVGVLIDGAGNDIYSGDTFTQGAGAFGVGLLFDGGGSDQYTGRLFSQGMGFAAGTGMLADAGGNDTYFAGGKYEDVLRYRDHYLSLSQGFGYGIRPHFSGGVGLLFDRDGNDLYVADIFAQGCSYWWSFGGLFDGGGNDQYVAFQYAQGSATHMTAGCLYDVSGDDRYESKGVSQGCGHDWAAGLLIDRAGNDRYIATDLSQGAGSANGVGVLIDGAGDDGYYVTSPVNTQGYGNPRREYGSIGLFLDLGGRDRYDGLGRDSTTWISSSKWGIGVDADSSWLAPPQEPSQ